MKVVYWIACCAACWLGAEQVVLASGPHRSDPVPSQAAPAAAPAPDEEAVAERFAAGTELIAGGAHAGAAALFDALVDEAPGSRVASDALFTAARLYEEELGDPARALARYERLVAEYPDSRTALAASRRAGALRQDIGPDRDGAVPLARFNQILHDFPSRDPRQSMAEMAALLAEFPDFRGRARALLWLAELEHRGGDHDAAMRHYLEAAGVAEKALASAPAAAPAAEDTGAREHLRAAHRGAGDVALSRGHFDEAARHYRRITTDDDASLRVVTESLARLGRERTRARLYAVSFAILALVAAGLFLSLRRAAGTWREAIAALVPPPPEVIFMVPIAVLLSGAALASHYAIGPAVIIVCSGGVVFTWLSGAGLAAGRKRPPGGKAWQPVAHAMATAVAVIALCYIAIHHGRLIDMIIDTVRFGPDV